MLLCWVCKELERPGAAKVKPVEKGAWRSIPNQILVEESHLQKTFRMGNTRRQPDPKKLAEKERGTGNGLWQHPCVGAGRGRAGRGEKPEEPWHRHLQPPRPHSSAHPAHRSQDRARGESSARGAQPTVLETTVEGPPGQAGLQRPQPVPAGTRMWALSRMDEHPSAVMPTDSSPPTDTLDICPHCPGPAAARTLLQCPPGLGGKRGHAGDTRQPRDRDTTA